jgi:hypothetical protein
MGLSSNALFHLTTSKENVRGILKEGFRLKYCVEIIETRKGRWKAAVPMVSFCDIPFSQIKNLLDSYGNYGIGLSTEWRQRMGLNPVLYVDKFSSIGAELKTFAQETLKGQPISAVDDSLLPIVNILRYSKNYEGDLKRTGKETIKGYRYSDEREWRYVPSAQDAQVIYHLDNYDDKSKKQKANATLEKLRLEFKPQDISYILIQSTSEIPEFIEFIKAQKFPKQEHERLLTRLVTVEQIRKDF